MNPRRAMFFGLVVIAFMPGLRGSPAAEAIDFDRELAPLLAARCLECHNPDDHKGDLDLTTARSVLRQAEPLVVPGKLDESLLWKQVIDDEMPPGKPLSASEKGMFKNWIESGASWGMIDPIDRFAFSTDTRAGADWWSLLPVMRPSLPAVEQSPWVRNPIDAFVLEKLEARRLSPAPPADKRTLIRRLYFDLLGLPPTPSEVDDFIHDADDQAYEHLIDRLLSSQHYGERWGRHWLDVARYTESQGFEYDRFRPHAWHYRDYVIKSLNEDKPYDVFLQEQIAGDVMNFASPAEGITPEGIIATSLLVCGPWDQAGNAQANATQKMITREEELEDMIGVIGQTILGMTINCARCHSHKFDPIPQEDYYRIKAVFEGVKHGERSIAPGSEEAEPEPTSKVRQERRDQLEQRSKSNLSYVGIRYQPDPTHRLIRGDVKSQAEIVSPAGLSTIKVPAGDFELAADAPEAERRLQFARWLADPRHPLTARVIVNRLWHHHFGRGIVETPNDFGFNGTRPSHPELLDWLAAEFVDGLHPWSIKHLHRLILATATYRQSSTFNADAAQVDAENVLLWRYSPRRLEGEIIRDAMLAVSGQLNRSMGGPSYMPFVITKFNSDFYQPIDPVEPEFQRRTIYRAHINSGKSPMMDALDCPDPSIKTPARRVTTTPLAALALMNNSFVIRQAEYLAKRVEQETDGSPGPMIDHAYRICMGRSATPDELHRAKDLVCLHGLPALCWALLNSSEFMYVN